MFTTSAIDPRTAGFGIRALARVIDAAVGVIIGLLASITALLVSVVRDPTADPDTWLGVMDDLTFVGTVMSILGNVAYHAITEAVGGASIGKLVCRLRVVTDDFMAPSFRATVTRSAAIVVDGLFFGLIAYRKMSNSPLQQRYGDDWAGTAVVRTGQTPAGARGAWRAVLGVVLGLFVWGLILTFDLVIRMANA
jgi:uncharacterized RDD family membrane protein YckC